MAMFYKQYQGREKAAKVVEFVAKWLNLCLSTVHQSHHWVSVITFYKRISFYCFSSWRFNSSHFHFLVNSTCFFFHAFTSLSWISLFNESEHTCCLLMPAEILLSSRTGPCCLSLTMVAWTTFLKADSLAEDTRRDLRVSMFLEPTAGVVDGSLVPPVGSSPTVD